MDLPIGGIQLFALAQSLLIAFTGFVFVDALLLFNPSVKKLIKGKRILPNMFSLGDPNSVEIKLSNNYFLSLGLTIIDELPDQFQKRDFEIKDRLPRGEEQTFKYKLTPTERGEYVFHNLNIFINGFLNLVNRRLIVDSTNQVAVYPSVLQMKKFELMAISRISTFQGVKKVRRLGHSYEFEQIRNYVKGDDYRSINWKATSRRNDLMVNQYEDERSQQIFSVIDKGRSMKMPFNGLSLMDYAINTSLVISNVALHKHDKAGLLTFSDKVGATVKADSGPRQLRTILEALYKEQERNLEANFELLYSACKKFIRRRSLMFLYTNFESYTSMVRVLPILRKINRLHLLVVIFFENTEIVDFAQQSAQNVEEIYNKTIAGRFVEEKYRIVRELRQYGIQSILTRPENLSLNTVNKYLELKARGMI
ncbi:MAG: DUF58 domain-containing protein [Saprospiraceae bacterium]|nr:DUF58 domain-containing protein [Saprospiraceae bacterium]